MTSSIGMSGARALKAGLMMGVFACGLHAAAILTLDPPSGAISGAPGDTVGWGFSLTNSTDYLVVSNSAFCAGAGPFIAADIGTTPCTTAYSSVGAFADYIATNVGNNSIVIGIGNPPDSNGGPACTALMTTGCDMPTLAQTFDSTMMTGVGQFAINPGATAGTLSGELLITYDLYSISPNNPTFDPATDLISTDNFFNPSASVTVTPAAGTVFEPGTLLLTTLGFASLGIRRLRRRM